MGFEGAATRRLDLHVWYPADATQRSDPATLAKGGPFPLVIYSHGTFGSADNAMHLVEHLVRHGYVVAAPDYPLTSSAAFTHIRFADISDVAQQTRDLRFIIDRLLADPVFGPAIDPTKIGTTGHSLGAVTSYFTSFGAQTRDPRIAATALIAGGDPVQSALMSDMGLLGTGHAAVRVPVLFLSADHDVFARTTGRPHASYSRVEGPKTEVMIKGGVHVWFRGTPEVPAGGKNPDCLFFERMMPTTVMPGCETPNDPKRGGLIDPARQQAITRAAVLDFFDGYFNRDAAALARLRGLHRQFKEASVISED
jgi:predicted dienelactone hydrolase